MKWQSIAAVVLVAVGVGAVAVVVVRPSFGNADTTQYLTATASRADVVDDVAANGSLVATTRYGMAFGTKSHLLGSDSSSASSSTSTTGSSSSSPSSGVTWPVTRVTVTSGQAVTRGQVLATADSKVARTALQLAHNDLATARLQLTDAEDQLSAASGDASIRQAQISVLNARTAVDRAAQSYEDDLTAANAATITAPANGIVEQVNVTTGLEAPGGDAIVLDVGGLLAQISVSETDLLALKVGQAATVTVTATDGTVDGVVSAIAPVGSTESGGGVVSYQVAVTLSSTPVGLRPGMSVSAAVTIAQARGVLSVPAIALQGSADAYTVRVLNADGSVSTRSVSVGLVTSGLAEIRSGLSAGDRVVTGVAANRTTATGAGGGIGGLGGLSGGGGGFRPPNQQAR